MNQPTFGEGVRPPALQQYPIVVRLPIQWGDLDAYGHVNNVVYLRWFEAARAVYATRVGVEVLSRTHGVGAMLTSLRWNFRRQLSYPGEVLVGVSVTRVSVGSVTVACGIADASTGVPVADGTCDVVMYDYAADRPVAVPDLIRQSVEQLEGKSFPL